MVVLAYDEAAGWYGQALGLVTGIGRESSDVRCKLLLCLGDAHERLRRQDPRRAAYLEAATLAKVLDDSQRLARATQALSDQVAQQVPTVDRPAAAPTVAAPRPPAAWRPAIKTVTPPPAPPTPPPPGPPGPPPDAGLRLRGRRPRPPLPSPRSRPPSPATTPVAPNVTSKVKRVKARAEAKASAEPVTARPKVRTSRRSAQKSSTPTTGTRRSTEVEDLAEITGLTDDLAEIATPRRARPQPPASQPPVTQSPVTQPPVTQSPVTQPPTPGRTLRRPCRTFRRPCRSWTPPTSSTWPTTTPRPPEADSAWAGVYDPRPTTTWVRENPASVGHSYSHERVVNSLRARHSRVWGPEDIEERLRASDQIIEMATGAEDDELALEGYGWRLVDRLEMGRVVQADEDIALHAALANASGDPRHRRTPPSGR